MASLFRPALTLTLSRRERGPEETTRCLATFATYNNPYAVAVRRVYEPDRPSVAGGRAGGLPAVGGPAQRNAAPRPPADGTTPRETITATSTGHGAPGAMSCRRDSSSRPPSFTPTILLDCSASMGGPAPSKFQVARPGRRGPGLCGLVPLGPLGGLRLCRRADGRLAAAATQEPMGPIAGVFGLARPSGAADRSGPCGGVAGRGPPPPRAGRGRQRSLDPGGFCRGLEILRWHGFWPRVAHVFDPREAEPGADRRRRVARRGDGPQPAGDDHPAHAAALSRACRRVPRLRADSIAASRTSPWRRSTARRRKGRFGRRYIPPLSLWERGRG